MGLLHLADCLRLDPRLRGNRLALLDDDAWLSVIRLANSHRLAPALASALDEADLLRSIPRDVRDYLVLLRDQNGRRNEIIRLQALEIIAAFQATGVEPMVVKGALTLIDTPHCDPSARMMADIDVVVRGAASDRAVAALERLGYHVADRYPEGHHAIAEFMRTGEPGAVDLHTELIDQRYVLPVSEVWRRARKTALDGVEFCVPSPTDRVLHALLHAQIHFRGDFYLGQLHLGSLYDFSRLILTYGAEIDWPSIERRMRNHRLVTPLHSYLLASNRLFGLSWPLSEPPEMTARLHFRRCLMQHHCPALIWIGRPWGNLRSAFAWHRMRGLYGDRNLNLLRRRLHHARQYRQRFGTRQTMKRLFRT